LSTSVAIRSFLDFELDSSIFETELVFRENPAGQLYRVNFERSLGRKPRGKVHIETYNGPFLAFLEDWRDYLYVRRKNEAIMHKFIEPLPHVALVRLCYANDQLFLPPTHPLLLLNYGMIYEGIATERWTYRSDEFDAGNLLSTLAFRFRAFLYQQEILALKATIGDVAIR